MLRWTDYAAACSSRIEPEGYADWRARLVALMASVQPAARECRVYGSSFNAASFQGQGAHVLGMMRKRGRMFVLPVDRDIVTGSECYWLDVDRSKPRSYPGEIYLDVDATRVDWVALGQLGQGVCVVVNAHAGASSVAGHRYARQRAQNGGCVVSVGARYVFIFPAPQDVVGLCKLAMLHVERRNGAGQVLVTPTPRHELLASL